MDKDPKKLNPTEDQAQWELSKGRSALATVALNGALLLNGALPHGQVDMHLPSRTETVEEVVVDTVTNEVTTVEDVAMPFQTADSVGEQWARRFAEDPQAGELLEESETTRVAAGIKELITDNNDCKIETIELTGRASDDDDSVNEQGARTGGLGHPDAEGKNVELAEERSSVFEEKLRTELESQGVATDQLPFVQMPGAEDILTADEMSQVDALVEQFGYDSRVAMIERYNRNPDDAPPAVAAFLDGALKAERTVTVVVRGTCIDEMASTAETTELVETIQRKEVEKDMKVTLPWFMIIPVPVPRHRKDEAETPVQPPVRPAQGRGRARNSHRPPTVPPPHVRGPKDQAYKPRNDRKYTGPDRGPKRYVGPNVHGGYWHV